MGASVISVGANGLDPFIQNAVAHGVQIGGYEVDEGTGEYLVSVSGDPVPDADRVSVTFIETRGRISGLEFVVMDQDSHTTPSVQVR